MSNEELFEKLANIITPLQEGQKRLEKDMTEIKTTQQEHTNTLKTHTTRFRGIKMILTRLRKDVHYISGDYDTRIVQNRRRIEKIETHLGIPHSN